MSRSKSCAIAMFILAISASLLMAEEPSNPKFGLPRFLPLDEPLAPVTKDTLSLRNLAKDLARQNRSRAAVGLVIYEGSQRDSETVQVPAFERPPDGLGNDVIRRQRRIQYTQELSLDARDTSATMELLKSRSEFKVVEVGENLILVDAALAADPSWVMQQPVLPVLKHDIKELTMVQAADLLTREFGMEPDCLGEAVLANADTIVWSRKEDGEGLLVRELLARVLKVRSSYGTQPTAFQVRPINPPAILNSKLRFSVLQLNSPAPWPPPPADQ